MHLECNGKLMPPPQMFPLIAASNEVNIHVPRDAPSPIQVAVTIVMCQRPRCEEHRMPEPKKRHMWLCGHQGKLLTVDANLPEFHK
jgi:hypothetical protein